MSTCFFCDNIKVENGHVFSRHDPLCPNEMLNQFSKIQDFSKGERMGGMELKNAVIISTSLGGHDGAGSIMTCMIRLDYGGSGQGFGGWSLDEPIKDDDGKFLCRKGSALGMQFIIDVLKVLELESWEDLKGTCCRVKADFDKIHAIGHFLKDQWFNPQEIGFK